MFELVFLPSSKYFRKFRHGDKRRTVNICSNVICHSGLDSVPAVLTDSGQHFANDLHQ